MWKEFKSLAPVEADVREIDGFQRWKQQIYQRSSDQDEFERFVNVSHCVISLLLYIHGLIVFLIKIKASPVPIGNSSALTWWLQESQQTSFPSRFQTSQTTSLLFLQADITGACIFLYPEKFLTERGLDRKWWSIRNASSHGYPSRLERIGRFLRAAGVFRQSRKLTSTQEDSSG